MANDRGLSKRRLQLHHFVIIPLIIEIVIILQHFEENRLGFELRF